MVVTLPQDALLSEQLDRAVARAIGADVGRGCQAETVFEAYGRTGIEPEQILDKIAEPALAEWSTEPVRESERTLKSREGTRRGQCHDREVALERQQ